MDRLQDKRFWLGGGAFAAVLILVIAWFLLIGPELSSTSDLEAQAASTQQQNSVLQAKVAALKAKSASLKKYTASLQSALLALPLDSGLSAFTRQVSAQATANHLVLSSVVIGSASVASGAGAPAAAPAAGSTASPATADPSGTTTAPAASTPASTSAGNLFAMQVTLRSSGTLTNQLAFLNAIRTVGPRRALILSTQLSPGATSKSSTSIAQSSSLTTQLTIFSAPQTPAQVVELNKLLSGKIGN